MESEQLDGEFILILVVFQEMVEFYTQSMVEARHHGRAPNKDYVFCQISPHINWRLKNSHELIKTLGFLKKYINFKISVYNDCNQLGKYIYMTTSQIHVPLPSKK